MSPSARPLPTAGGRTLPWLAALLAVAAACASDPYGSYGNDRGRSRTREDRAGLVCDVREEACHRQIFEFVGEILQRPTLEAVPVVEMTAEEWVDEQTAALWPAGDVHDVIQAEALFQIGLLREWLDAPDDAALDALGDRVAASYGGSPPRIALVVPEGAWELDQETATSYLVHEATHAYQDAHFRLFELEAALSAAGDLPEIDLLRAAVEGQAMVVEGFLAARLLDVAPADLDWHRWVATVVDDVFSRAEAATSPYIEARSGIWYAAGAAMAVHVLEAADWDIAATHELIRRPPRDMAAVLAFLRAPPGAALEQRAQRLTLPVAPDAPAPLLTPATLDEWALSWYGTWRLSAWDIALLLTPELGVWDATELATGCSHGALEVFLTEDGATVTLLHTRWDVNSTAELAALHIRSPHLRAAWKPYESRDHAVVRQEGHDVVLVVSPDAALSTALAAAARPAP